MFKKTLVMIIAVTGTTLLAQAADPYIGAGVNYSKLKDADDGGISYEGVLGMGIGQAMRIEGALGYDNADIGNVDIDVWSLFANLYYDFKLDGALTPYVLAGLGYSEVRAEGNGSDGSFGAQFGGGVGFNINENWIIDLRYRYLVSQEYFDSVNFNAHQLGLGFRFQF